MTKVKQWKKGLGLAAVLSLSLAACGTAQRDVAGADWRTTGVIIDYGTITHNGESVAVAVTADENSAAFYWNMPEQILYDSVLFPNEGDDPRAGLTQEDLRDAGVSVSFDDLDGDGESDVTVHINHADMSETEMVWIWDPVERYVYQPQSSYYHEMGAEPYPEDSFDAYIGLWSYADENLWLYLYGDATWEFVNSRRDVIDSGTAVPDVYGVELHAEGSGDVLRLEYGADGELLDEVNGGTLTRIGDVDAPFPVG